jgi:hypothetical protein
MQQHDMFSRRQGYWFSSKGVWLGVALLLLAGGVSNARAEGVVYVQSLKASLLAQPRFGAEVLVEVERGAALPVLQQQHDWYQVGPEDQQGWIYRLQVASQPPAEKVSLLTGAGNDLASGARRRASSFTTSAAARGLAEDRLRMSGGHWTADMSKVDTLEELEIPLAEVIDFHKGVKP